MEWIDAGLGVHVVSQPVTQNEDSCTRRVARHQGTHALYRTWDLVGRSTAKAKHKTVARLLPGVVAGERKKQESFFRGSNRDIEVVESIRHGYRDMHSRRGAVHREEVSKFSSNGFDQHLPSLAVDLSDKGQVIALVFWASGRTTMRPSKTARARPSSTPLYSSRLVQCGFAWSMVVWWSTCCWPATS